MPFNGPNLDGAARRLLCSALLALAGLTLALPAQAQIQFAGPAVVKLDSEALSAVSLTLEVGNPDFLVSGSGEGIVSLHRYSLNLARFLYEGGYFVEGRVVAMIPWEGRPLLHQGVVVATVNPDRVMFFEVLTETPFFILEGSVDLEEDPGTLSFIGEIIGGVPELAVSLPGIDKVAVLRQTGEDWNISTVLDTGDDPYSLLGLDIDGDQVRELVTANRGPLSGNLGVFRRDLLGNYSGTQQDFSAGSPSCLAKYDVEGDGQMELAATVKGTPELVLLRGTGGQLVEYDSVGLTLPADGVHLTSMFDGSPGLFTANQERGLVDFFQFSQGNWIRRNSYYPGCTPLATISGEFNGDDGRDLVSIGGDANLLTAMFANSEPGFWGFPALALNASPGGLGYGDFDGDGLSDIVVANGNQRRLSFFPGLAVGGFDVTPVDYSLSFYPGEVAVLNTDDDPGPELAVLDFSGGLVHIADFVPGPGFSIVSETPTGVFPSSLTSRDIDVDGHDDLVIVTGAADEVLVLFGAGDHTFPARTTLGLGNDAERAEALDLNADGLHDLAFTDGSNYLWTALNQGGRTFGALSWLNAGSGASFMAVGDLDQDLDEDVVVVNRSDESLTMFENTGNGVLNRRIGALALTSAPSGIVISDLDQDGRPELVMNLRDENVVNIAITQDSWDYFQSVSLDGGPDVTAFNVEDFNFDDMPDILTLDRSLLLGLTLLNVEQELVAVEPTALAFVCSAHDLTIRIKPDRPGPWQVDFGVDGQWTPLAVSGQAVRGEMDYDRGTWILSVDRGDVAGAARTGWLRLTVGEGDRRESLDLSLTNQCPRNDTGDLPVVSWAREPWPNPFNPLINARFDLGSGSLVEAGVYDLGGRRIAVLADGWFEAGTHALQWDGRQSGRPAGAGVYLLRIGTSQNTLLHKIMLVK